MKYCYSDFFADDATFHTHDKLFERVEMKSQSGADTAKGWSRQNKMHIHYDKTNYMVLGGMHKLNDNNEFDLKIDSNQIKKTRNQKLLGIYIDDKLSWTTHIDHLCSTISSKISLQKQLSRYVSTDIQTKFYQGYIRPLIEYGSVVWGTTSSSNLDRISKLQKHAARILLHADFNTPSAAMFEELGWLPINKRLKYNKAVFTYSPEQFNTPIYYRPTETNV